MGGGADGLEYLPCPAGRMSAESTVVEHLLIDEAISERLRGSRSATDLKTPSHHLPASTSSSPCHPERAPMMVKDMRGRRARGK